MRRNDQFAVENRRNWKGEVFDYDAIQAYEPHECQYCLTDAQVAVLGGIIEQFGWVTRWQSETQDIDEVWVRDFKADIARRLMMSCCNDDLIYTYDEDGNLEVSDDGGTTYTPSPQDDIRINPEVIFPVPTGDLGDNAKCTMSDGMVDLLKEQIGDQLTDDMSRYTLSQLINDWTKTMIGTSNPFVALVTIISNQIFALVIASVRAAINDATYDTLRCIFYSHIQEDGSFNNDEWEAVRSDILSQITGVAGVFFEHLVYLLGNGGLTNLARAGAGNTDADCSDCSDTCPSKYEAGGAGYGMETDRTDDTITVEGVIDARVGGYAVSVIATDYNNCCQVTFDLVSGTITAGSHGWAGCGEVPNPDSFNHNDGTLGGCFSMFVLYSTAPFTVVFNFIDCP